MPTNTPTIVVSDLSFDGRESRNEPGEYIELQNIDYEPAELDFEASPATEGEGQ